MAQLQGSLSVMPLADLVVWLGNRRMTGRLEVRNRRVEKAFDLSEGTVIRAASNDPREYFGQFLVHLGLLTEDQLLRAFQTQSETKVLLGRILVMIGIVPEEQVIQTLRVKLSESLLDMFRWNEGEFTFDDGPPQEARPQIEVQVPLLDIHREGQARQQMWESYQSLFPDARWVLTVQEDRVPEGAGPDTLDGRILALARHGLSIEAITLDLHATDYQVATRLLHLHQVGAIAPREPSHTLLPLRADDAVSHLARAHRALKDERYSDALRYLDELGPEHAQTPEVSELRQQLQARATAGLDRSAVPRLVADPTSERLRRLSAKQRYVLARIDGMRDVDAIIQVSPMHDEEALEILQQFHAERLIEV